MNAQLLDAIFQMIDIAESAATVLDNYSDLESDGDGGMVPNSAAAYKQYLEEATDALWNAIPQEYRPL